MHCILNVFDIHSHFKSLRNIFSIFLENDTKAFLLNIDSSSMTRFHMVPTGSAMQSGKASLSHGTLGNDPVCRTREQ